MIKVYLVRHGKSEDHSNGRRQSPNSKLGKEGIEQAKRLALRLKNEHFDAILSSRWTRALETAQEIEKLNKAKLQQFEGIQEIEHNPKVYGLDYFDKTAREFLHQREENKLDPHWKYEGKGETLLDVYKRAQSFEEHIIANYKGQTILVVSHGHFIRCLITSCLLGDKSEDTLFPHIIHKLEVGNTSLSLIEYDEDQNHWKLSFFNDLNHLT